MLASPRTPDELASGELDTAADDTEPVSEPDQSLDCQPSETNTTGDATTETNSEAEDDEWLPQEWQESTLLPVPWPDGAIQDWRPAAPRCAAFPSRDPEFSISLPAFEAPQLSEIGKIPEPVTDAASWQGHADPGQSLEIHWQDTPLGKLSTECVAGSMVRLAFPAMGMEGRGHGPLPVRPIGPIGLPQKLAPPPDGPTTEEAAMQGPRRELSRQPTAPRLESESDVDQVEARLQSLTALARSTQRPAEEPPRPVAPTTEISDKDEGQAPGFIPPPAVNTPLPVTLLGSAAPRRRATVVFPIGIQAALGPVMSIPARVPIREVIYLLGDPNASEIEMEYLDEIEPFEVPESFYEEVPSALADDPHRYDDSPEYDDLADYDDLREYDEQDDQGEVSPQEGPEHV